jgi:iron complex transport system substrate-binding protein
VRLPALIAVTILCAALAFPEGGPSPTPPHVSFPLAVTDDAGNAIVLPAKPKRIVSLTLFTDEMLLPLIESRRLVAITPFAADAGVSNVAGLAAAVAVRMELNVEAVISLRPDIVFVANWTGPDKIRQLRDAGVPVYLIATGFTVAAIAGKIESVARIAGEPEGGARLIAGMRERIAAVARKVSTIPEAKRLRALDYETFGAAMGRGSSWDEMLRIAGLVNAVGGHVADEWGQIPLSKEKLLEIDPDILFLPTWVYGDPAGAESFRRETLNDPALQGLKAVRERRVYQMPERLKQTTSQYIAEAVEFLAKTAYPELFR